MKFIFVPIICLFMSSTPGLALDWFQKKGYSFKKSVDIHQNQITGTTVYNHHDRWYSEELILLSDGRFLFTGMYEGGGRCLAAGSWKPYKKNGIILNTDDDLSLRIAMSKDSCKAYGLEYAYSQILTFIEWSLRKQKDLLVTTGFEGSIPRAIKETERSIKSLNLSKCKILTDSYYFLKPNGDTTGKGFRDFWYTGDGQLIKVISYKILNTNIRDVSQVIYFLPEKIVKVERFSGRQEKTIASYFSGQKLIYADNEKDGWVDYDNACHLKRAFETLYDSKKAEDSPDIK